MQHSTLRHAVTAIAKSALISTAPNQQYSQFCNFVTYSNISLQPLQMCRDLGAIVIQSSVVTAVTAITRMCFDHWF